VVFTAYELLIAIVSLLIGFLISYWLISRLKWGDKKKALVLQYANKLLEIKKDVEIKLEKKNTEIEKRDKDWRVKYLEDIEELKTLFKESEKRIRDKSVSASRRSLVGKFIERFVPFLSNVKYAPADMHFMGAPIDYIVFDGLRDDKIKKVVFLEVKTGKSVLTKREKSLKEAIERKRVKWEQITVDTTETKTPDKEMTEEGSTVEDLYEHMENKLKTVRGTAEVAFKVKDSKKK